MAERWLVKVVYWTGIESIKGIFDTFEHAEDVAWGYNSQYQTDNYIVEKYNPNIHWLKSTEEKK